MSAIPSGPPVPLIQSLKVMLDELANPQQIDGVRAASLVGILRHVEIDRQLADVPGAQRRLVGNNAENRIANATAIALVLRNVWVWIHFGLAKGKSNEEPLLFLELLRFEEMLLWITQVVQQLLAQTRPKGWITRPTNELRHQRDNTPNFEV